MELLETQDPDKKKLIETSERHRRELQKEVKAISERTERILINALVIGGSLALTYYIISQWTGKRKKKKAKQRRVENGAPEAEEVDVPETPSVISQLGSKLMNQATVILLDIAKEKLFEYLESRKQTNENS